jgi:hypothetical protein
MSRKLLIKALVAGLLTCFTTIAAGAIASSRKTKEGKCQPRVQIESRPADSLVTEIRVGRNEHIRNLDELEQWLEESEWVELEITFVPSPLEGMTTYYNWVSVQNLIELHAKVFFAAD